MFLFKLYDKKNKEQLLDDLMNKIQDSIIRTGKMVIEEYHRQIRIMDSERFSTDWSFLKFFCLKEGLAFIYEALKLYDDAIIQYDELQLLYELTSKDRIDFKGFGGKDEGDDSYSVLDFTKKDYRNLILTSNITIFDFLKYLFARQTHILFLQSKTITVATRGIQFINHFVSLLKNEGFSDSYCAIWSFSAYLDIAESCKANAWRNPLSDTSESSIQFHLGDLYFNSLLQFELLGIEYNLLPPNSNHIFMKDDLVLYNKEVNNDVLESHPSLSVALSSTDSFDKLYKSISNKAKLSYRDCKRERSNTRLRYGLANLSFYRGRFSEAIESLILVKNHYLTDRWPDLLFYAYNKLAECYKQLGNVSEYIKCILELFSPKLLSCSDNEMKNIWMNELIRVSNLNNPIEINEIMVFDFDIIFNKGKNYSLDEIIEGDIYIYNRFPNQLTMKSARVIFTLKSKKGRNKTLSFNVKGNNSDENQLILEKGKNHFKIEAEGQRGRWRISNIIINIGNIQINQRLTKQTFPTSKVSLIVNSSSSTTEIGVSQPECLFLNTNQSLKVEITTNDDSISNAEMKVQFINNITKLLSNEFIGYLIKDDVTKMALKLNYQQDLGIIKIPNIERYHTLQFNLPIFTHSDNDSIDKLTEEISFELNYTKSTNEKKNVKNLFELTFIKTLNIRHKIISSQSRHFAHIIIQSNCPVPLEICDYSYQLLNNNDEDNKSNYVLEDLNRKSMNESIILCKDEEITYIFEIKNSNNEENEINHNLYMKLNIEFMYSKRKYKEQSLEERKNKMMLSQHELMFSFQDKYYSITYNHPKESIKTNPIDLKIHINPLNIKRIRDLLEQGKDPAIYYTIVYERDTWIIIGKQFGKLENIIIDNDKMNNYELLLRIIPLKSGYISLPHIKIIEYSNIQSEKTRNIIDMEYIDHKYQHESFVSYPMKTLTINCENLIV